MVVILPALSSDFACKYHSPFSDLSTGLLIKVVHDDGVEVGSHDDST